MQNSLVKFVFAGARDSLAVSKCLNVENSRSVEDSTATDSGSEFWEFIGYDAGGCVWGVKTGAFWGHTY